MSISSAMSDVFGIPSARKILRSIAPFDRKDVALPWKETAFQECAV